MVGFISVLIVISASFALAEEVVNLKVTGFQITQDKLGYPQLENEIERATTLADNNSFIKPSDLSEEVYKYAEHTQTVNLLSKKINLKDAVENLEKIMIQKSLEESNWNQTQCAKDLGLSRQGLIKKMKRYNLYREEDEQA